MLVAGLVSVTVAIPLRSSFRIPLVVPRPAPVQPPAAVLLSPAAVLSSLLPPAVVVVSPPPPELPVSPMQSAASLASSWEWKFVVVPIAMVLLLPVTCLPPVVILLPVILVPGLVILLPVVALPLVVPVVVLLPVVMPVLAPVLARELIPGSALPVLAPVPPRFASVRLSRRAGPWAPEVP